MNLTEAPSTAPTSKYRAKLGLSLVDLLQSSNLDEGLIRTVTGLATSCSKIAVALREGSDSGCGTEPAGSHNPFGDAQLPVDLRTEQIIVEELVACGAVAMVSSEENPVEKVLVDTACSPKTDRPGGLYSVAFDPLDGSSIIASNWAVGTIVG